MKPSEDSVHIHSPRHVRGLDKAVLALIALAPYHFRGKGPTIAFESVRNSRAPILNKFCMTMLSCYHTNARSFSWSVCLFLLAVQMLPKHQV
jgi:hypothetical protein